LRRDRKDDKEWLKLPAEGFDGDVPAYPLSKVPVYDVYFAEKQRVQELDEGATDERWDAELALWEDLWRKPQAHMWAALGLKYQVAAYTRAYIEATGPDSNAGLKTAALRMEAELGLSTVGMGQLRWKISTDEVAERREEAEPPARKSARERLKAING